MGGTDDGDPLALPEHLKQRPRDRYRWDLPTAWLLGTQLASSLRDIVTSEVSDFDGRDWMSVNGVVGLDKTAIADEEDGTACWIDFLADSGDSPRLVYQLAYLLQQPTLRVLVKQGGADVELADNEGAPRALPRGRALLFGGDTAYPVASRRRLLERIRAPFIWARQELEAKQRLPPLESKSPLIHLLGIPGNHDYYNELSGFERMFHAADAGNPDVHPKTPACERVDLPGYQLAQQASYFAAELPFGWQLWGLDVERDKLGIDDRQVAYFQHVAKVAAAGRKPGELTKRIILTSKPTVVNHALSDAEPRLAESFRALGLPLAFAENGTLASDQIRLDLSGDTHLYERYWGRDAHTDTAAIATPARDAVAQKAHDASFRPAGIWTAQGEQPAGGVAASPAISRGNETQAQEVSDDRANYASVVSGLGGAFHHPSQVRFGNMAPRCAWPTSEASARAVGEQLIRPRKMFQAGAVGVIGLVLAAVTFLLVRCAGDVPNVLDAPFRVAQSPPNMVWKILAAGSIIAVIAALIGLVVIGIQVGNWLASSIVAMTPPRSAWLRATHWLSHNAVVFWCLRWLGGNRRNMWTLLATSPAWGAVLAAWIGAIYALTRCRYFATIADGYGALYVITAILGLGLFGLGAGLAGQQFATRARSKFPGRSRSIGSWIGELLGRVMFGAFGLVTALLIVWTPYAWTKLAFVPGHRLYALLVFAYAVFRLVVLRSGFTSNVWLRRLIATGAFVLIAAFYCLVPCWLLGRVGTVELPLWGVVLAAVLGAYLICLWMGWYFFVCLQFDGHGNEAGSAARIVKFAQFMRIKLTANRAEVWVIAAETPALPPRTLRRPCRLGAVPDDEPPIARLVDHFVVQARDA